MTTIDSKCECEFCQCFFFCLFVFRHGQVRVKVITPPSPIDCWDGPQLTPWPLTGIRRWKKENILYGFLFLKKRDQDCKCFQQYCKTKKTLVPAVLLVSFGWYRRNWGKLEEQVKENQSSEKWTRSWSGALIRDQHIPENTSLSLRRRQEVN